MLADGRADAHQPVAVFDQFQQIRRGEILDAVGRGLPSGLSSLAATSAGMSCGWQFNTQRRLLRRQAGGQLAQQRQKLMLVVTHIGSNFLASQSCHRLRFEPPQSRQRTSSPTAHFRRVRSHLGNRNSTRSLSPAVGGRALRARPPSHRPRNPFQFDTRHNSFGVLSSASVGGLSGSVFWRPQGTCPLTSPRTIYTARNRRGCLIAKATHCGNRPTVKPRRFCHQPVFSCVPAAASVSTRINTRYQADNRCRQRHRVRKAVFTQLIRICPKAFADVFRAGQCAVVLSNIYPRPTRLNASTAIQPGVAACDSCE
jgi:hypothetical protein